MLRLWGFAAAFLAWVACQFGCQQVPGTGAGLQRDILTAGQFRLALTRPNLKAVRQPLARPWRIVLIDGDGRAFLTPTRVAADPTPRRSWLYDQIGPLQAIAETQYLGRPCYWQTADPACHPRFWTTHRYSSVVRDSLRVAIESIAADGARLILVGYSGGGYLAIRLAQRLPTSVGALVTIAAPMNPSAWTAHHGYTPLVDADAAPPGDLPLPQRCQRHLIGSRDRELPLALTRTWLPPVTESVVLSDARHDCCWEAALRSALKGLLNDCSALRSEL
ncbi:MAG: hypothetical protein AAGG11_18630 [Pseudomonadota bacterium]